MSTKRIIPCLDIRDGRAVKGVHFEQIRDAGDPLELAAFYSEQGADELVFLDITATTERRSTFFSLVEKLAARATIPFTVGGGISKPEDAARLIESGAAKVSINTAAWRNPDLIAQIAARHGTGCVVAAIDVKQEDDGGWYVYISGGSEATGKLATDWAREVVAAGAGEILLTSMSQDGTKGGFALDITARIAGDVKVPVIASGGAGNKEHFLEVFKETGADAALAASVFHFGEIRIPELKKYLIDHHINVNLYGA